MTKKKVLGVVFSDLHIGEYAKFNKDNQRVLNHFRVLYLIKELCDKHRCPAFFCGDLLHKPEHITTSLDELIIENLDNLRISDTFNIYGISGNHDMCSKNSPQQQSPSHWSNLCNRFSFLHNLDFKHHEFKDFVVYGIPYLDHNVDLDKAIKALDMDPAKRSILLLHTDYPGAKDTDGLEVGTVENLNVNQLSKFGLTLIGHIHKPQRLGKKVYMVGAPLQQRRTDRGCDLGCWLILEDFTMKFHPFKGFPKFIDVEDEGKILDDGNYYTLINKPKAVEASSNIRIDKNLSKPRLVRKYLKIRDIKDIRKRDLLLDILKKAEEDDQF